MKIAGSQFHRRSIAAANAEADRLREQINRYEAAQVSSPKRSWLPAFVRDARFDANSFSRWEMSRKIRYFERNTWLVQRIRDEFKKWTVGPGGLQVIPASSDYDWNQRMNDDYQSWSEAPCLDSTINMAQVHGQIAGEFNIEREIFVHYTRRKLTGRASEPMIQLIRSHRVSSPGVEYSAKEEEDLVDGVQLGKDALGKVVGPTGYWVRDDFAGTEWTFRGLDVMQHVFDPEIVGMYRGITPYHAVINTLNDIEDLEQFEMERAKENAQDAKIIKTVTGEAPIGGNFVRERFRSGSGGSAPSQESDIEKRMEIYRRVLGARTVSLKVGEEVDTPNNPSPSAAQQWFWRYKLGQVSAAAGVPLILIFPELIESIQGTVVRGIYDNAHEFFRAHTYLFAQAAMRIYRYRANWARYNITKLADAPADWNKCHVIPPRAVNVDVGYTTESKIAELDAGLTDYDRIAGAHGGTAEVIFRRKAKQIALIKRIAQEESKLSGFEVKPEEIAGSLADILEKLAAAKAATEPDDDDQAPTPKKRKPQPANA